MRQVTDLVVDHSDDIVISSGDIQHEYDSKISTFRIAQRRCSARLDDMDYTPEFCLGLESYLNQHETPYFISNIETDISSVLTLDGLLSSTDYTLFLDRTRDRSLQATIIVKMPGEDFNPEYSFVVYSNNQNQKSYV